MMRYLIIIALLLAGCMTDTGPTSGDVPAAQDARSTEAAAAVAAAKSINRQQPESRTTEVVDRELEVAQANLPLPSQAQLSAAQDRAQAALVAERDQLFTLYASALDNAAKLQRELDTAREAAARQAANEESRREALMLQTRITTYAAIAFMILGAGIGWTGNIRIGAACAFMWWAYRTGLFQRPPASVGEFELQASN